MTAYTDKGAIISQCGKFRYRLWREWESVSLFGPDIAVFIMLNPSTADGSDDDPTIRRCVSFARSWGCRRLEVVNLFAYRATDPKDLLAMNAARYDAIGPENDGTILSVLNSSQSRIVVCAWGEAGLSLGRGDAIKAALVRGGYEPKALRVSKSGMAGHPLYIPSDAQLVDYR